MCAAFATLEFYFPKRHFNLSSFMSQMISSPNQLNIWNDFQVCCSIRPYSSDQQQSMQFRLKFTLHNNCKTIWRTENWSLHLWNMCLEHIYGWCIVFAVSFVAPLQKWSYKEIFSAPFHISWKIVSRFWYIGMVTIRWPNVCGSKNHIYLCFCLLFILLRFEIIIIVV